MRRSIVIFLVVIAALLVGSQLLLPPYLEGRIEDRLTADGGTADVSLEALPALRLLAGDGDRLSATGNGLSVDLTAPRPEVLERLEGFDEVDVRLADVSAGPFRTRDFRLTRAAGSPRYSLAVSATVSPRELSRFAASELAGPLGGVLGDLAAGSSPLLDAPVPVELETEIEQVEGRWRTVGGTGTVAGIPAGPVAEAIAAAIVTRL